MSLIITEEIERTEVARLNLLLFIQIINHEKDSVSSDTEHCGNIVHERDELDVRRQ